MRHANKLAILLLLIPTLSFGQGISPTSGGGGGSGTVTSLSVVTANGVSGSVANPTTTPAITLTLGAIVPTTVNGNTITTGTYTLTGAGGKTLTFNNSLTLAGTDATTMNFPATNATLARTDAGQAFTGVQTISSGATLPSPVTANVLLQVAGTTSAPTVLEIDGFAGTNGITFRRANTSSTAPSALVSPNIIANTLYQGWNGAAYVTGANIRVTTTATTWDGSHNGAFLDFLTAPDSGGAAGFALRVQGSGGISVGSANIATDGGTGIIVATGTTLTGTAVKFTGIGTDAAATDTTACVLSDGTIVKGSGTIGICLGTSSERFKPFISSLDVGLSQIMALQPIKYRVDAAHGDPDKMLYGFTAEQGGIVLPALMERDINGVPNTFDYLGIVPVLVKALQEQQEQIDKLKTMLSKN